jgi:hypothetical protein
MCGNFKMTEIVKEWTTVDGIGAMLWKKIYAMSYAYKHKLLFEDSPFKGFLIHESDKITNRSEYDLVLDQFNNLLFNPWSEIDFDLIKNKIISDKIGLGLGMGEMGFGLIRETDFLLEAPVFNKITNDDTNNVVIHLRRGNAIPENPRYTNDEFYLNLLSQITMLFDKFNLINPPVVICTDAPDTPKRFNPGVNDHISVKDTAYQYTVIQSNMWTQPHLYPDENGEYALTSANFDEYRKVYPSVKIVNNLFTYDAFLLMLRAKILITANSSFSQSAGLLSHNRVIGMPPKFGMSELFNTFRNKVGMLDSNGNIII